MPARQASLAITDQYRARLLEQRQRAVRAAGSAWLRLSLDDLSGTFASWLAIATAVTEAAQRAGVTLTRAYLATYLASELGRQTATPMIVDDAYVGQDGFGRGLQRALLPPLLTVKMRIGQGATPGQALGMGLNRATRLVATAAMSAPRGALSDAIQADDQIVGWRRVTAGNACGACLGAATGAIQHDEEVLLVHDSCRCGKEPVVKGVRERVLRPTGQEIFDSLSREQQDVLFAGRGGAEKADLVRAGQVELDGLITRQRLALGGEVITETPLATLAGT